MSELMIGEIPVSQLVAKYQTPFMCMMRKNWKIQ